MEKKFILKPENLKELPKEYYNHNNYTYVDESLFHARRFSLEKHIFLHCINITMEHDLSNGDMKISQKTFNKIILHLKLTKNHHLNEDLESRIESYMSHLYLLRVEACYDGEEFCNILRNKGYWNQENNNRFTQEAIKDILNEHNVKVKGRWIEEIAQYIISGHFNFQKRLDHIKQILLEQRNIGSTNAASIKQVINELIKYCTAKKQAYIRRILFEQSTFFIGNIILASVCAGLIELDNSITHDHKTITDMINFFKWIDIGAFIMIAVIVIYSGYRINRLNYTINSLIDVARDIEKNINSPNNRPALQ